MKKLTRWGAFLIALVVMVSVCGIRASAAGVMILPASLTVIEEQAFSGDVHLEEVVLPDRMERIESRAFADSSVKRINLPSSITYIAEDAFRNCDSIVASVVLDTYAWQYCRDHEIQYTVSGEELEYTVQYNDHSYRLVRRVTSWEEARVACETVGGHLLTINSAGEQEMIESLLLEHGAGNAAYWIGLTDVSGEGNWSEWITEEKVAYTHWKDEAQGIPEGMRKNVSILTGDGPEGTWNHGDWETDASVGSMIDGYICEWGYQSTYRALLIGERTFLNWSRNADQTINWFISPADRNVGDVNNMEAMLNNVYGNDGIGQYAVTKRVDLNYYGIRNAIQNTFADTKDYDVSLFFIATHGDHTKNGELQMPFLGDVDNEEDTYGYYRDNYLLSFDTLASWLTQYTRGKVIVILESCGAGSAIYSEYEQNSVASRKGGTDPELMEVDLAETAIQAFSKADPGIPVYGGEAIVQSEQKLSGDLRIPKYYVLACSRHKEQSWGNEYSNYFTNWLIKGVGTAENSPADTSPKDHTLTLTELFTYIKQYDETPIVIYENGQYITFYQHVQRYPVNSQFQLFRHP